MMFGDGPNDMEIFDYVGLKIAMGNATPELKAKADYVTGTVEEDGIFNALEELGLVEKELHFPQLDLDAVEGPVATIKTNHGDWSSSFSLTMRHWLSLTLSIWPRAAIMMV